MPGVTGRTVKMAFAKFGTNSWNVAASVTKGVYFKSDAGMIYKPEVIEDKSFGNIDVGPSDRGNIEPVDLTFESQSRYDDNSYVLDALAMGSPATVTISTSAAAQPTSWLHVIDLADSGDGLGATFASDCTQYVKELTNGKVYGWTEANDSGVMQTTYRVIGNVVTVQSSVNINSTLAGAVFPALGNWVLKKQGTWRMNAQAGGALGASDANAFVEAVSFEWQRPQDQSHAFGSAYMIEPADNDFRTYTLKLTFARMNTVSANSLRVGLQANTAYKADLTFLGNYINSTDQYKKMYQFPYLEITDFVDTVDGAGQVKPEVTMAARKPAAAPTGMTGVVRPFRLTRIMTTSVHAFA